MITERPLMMVPTTTHDACPDHAGSDEADDDQTEITDCMPTAESTSMSEQPIYDSNCCSARSSAIS